MNSIDIIIIISALSALLIVCIIFSVHKNQENEINEHLLEHERARNQNYYKDYKWMHEHTITLNRTIWDLKAKLKQLEDEEETPLKSSIRPLTDKEKAIYRSVIDAFGNSFPAERFAPNCMPLILRRYKPETVGPKPDPIVSDAEIIEISARNIRYKIENEELRALLQNKLEELGKLNNVLEEMSEKYER